MTGRFGQVRDADAVHDNANENCRIAYCGVTTHLPTTKGWKAELVWLVDP